MQTCEQVRCEIVVWLLLPISDSSPFTLAPFSGPEFTREQSGCTAVAALVTNENKVYVVCLFSTNRTFVCYQCAKSLAFPFSQANAGDSRSVISIKGEAKQLSYDHKPQNDSEWFR